MRFSGVVVGTALLPLAIVLGTPLKATAASTNTGCPAAYQLRSVESLAATGNAPLPGLIDAAGNADGFVCALPLPDAVCLASFDPCPVETTYNYQDNFVPERD